MKLFAFDFDGTLADSSALICRVMKQAFLDNSHQPPTNHQIRHIIGITLEQAVQELSPTLSQQECLLIAQSYKNIYRSEREQNSDQERLFDGVVNILKIINDHNHLAGVVTGKSLRGLDMALDQFNIRSYFIGYQTSDHHPSKPNPSMLQALMDQASVTPEKTIVIGDTSWDMMMARSAKAFAVGVSWGCHDTQTLRQAGADLIIDDLSQLKEFL